MSGRTEVPLDSPKHLEYARNKGAQHHGRAIFRDIYHPDEPDQDVGYLSVRVQIVTKLVVYDKAEIHTIAK